VYSVKNYKKQLVQVKVVQIKSKLDKKLNYGQLTAKVETNLEFVNLPNAKNSEKVKLKLREKTEWIDSLKDSIPGLEEYSEIVIDTLNEIQDLETSQGIIITGSVGIGKTYFCKKIIGKTNIISYLQL
jgi:type II secretory ATPase GspE/PulE/Tfp pilus assembly ATPase PilB-like protein